MAYLHNQERSIIEGKIIEEFGGFTRFENVVGAWKNPDTGEVFVDDVDKYEILTFHTRVFINESIGEILNDFKVAYGQECLPYTIVESTNVYV